MRSPTSIRQVLCVAVLVLGLGGKVEVMAGMMHNEDCTNFFYFQTFPSGKAAEITDRYVDVLADGGVTVLLCNTNARRTNYRSAVWEAFWDGYDPDGPDDQPFLKSIPAAAVKRFRTLVGNMLEVHRQGVDYPARVIQRCRQRGISPWITLRMNDVHHNDNLEHPFHGPLWRRPELFRRGHPGYFARALDYARQEVRDHYRALIAETLERYDIDGLELDFMREPYLFSTGEEEAGRAILTAWMRDVRRLVSEASTRRGHPIKLSVRVPSQPEVALGLGLDAPAWAAEDLIDVLVATPRWTTLHFDIPLERWRHLLGDKILLAGGLEIRYQPYRGGPARPVTAEEATGAAVSVLSSGADVVYLFNYFQHGHWPLGEYKALLKRLSSPLEELVKYPRRHAVTYREIVVPGSEYRPPLPASGQDLSFELPLGPVSPPDTRVEVCIRLADRSASLPAPKVALNRTPCELRNTEGAGEGGQLLTYGVPPGACSNESTIAITTQDAPVKVLSVEVTFTPAAGE